MDRFTQYWLMVTIALVCAATYAASVVYPLGPVIMWAAVAGGTLAGIAAIIQGLAIGETRWLITLVAMIAIGMSVSPAYGVDPSKEVAAGIVTATLALAALVATIWHFVRSFNAR